MPFFNDLPLLPDDPIFGIPLLFASDPRSIKVNLGIGAYKTVEGIPLVLNSVKKAEFQILKKNLNKEYLPIDGDGEFIESSLQLLFGPDLSNLNRQQVLAAQTIGGAGALRIAGELLAKSISKSIFLSQPSWPNHKPIFERAGLNVGSYPYLDLKTNQLDFQGMCEAIKNMPSSSAILLHGICHNPTGIDPSLEQWKELSGLIRKKQLLPFFDIAYHGFGQDLEKDAEPIRLFARDGHEMVTAYSFSKNFGLYGERVGFLTIVSSNTEATPKLASQVKTLIRSNYSNPPLHGARIVKTILRTSELLLEWQTELENMRDRVHQMRKALVAALLVKGERKKDFSYMHKQCGLFSLCGLNFDQIQRLRAEKGIYMTNNGRINVAGLNTTNLEYVADAILSVM